MLHRYCRVCADAHRQGFDVPLRLVGGSDVSAFRVSHQASDRYHVIKGRVKCVSWEKLDVHLSHGYDPSDSSLGQNRTSGEATAVI